MSCPLLASAYPQACRSIGGCAFNPSLATAPARSITRANPAVLNGAPRPEVNTKGDLGSFSRYSRRRARGSSQRIGCVLGVPCLALQTCREPDKL